MGVLVSSPQHWSPFCKVASSCHRCDSCGHAKKVKCKKFERNCMCMQRDRPERSVPPPRQSTPLRILVKLRTFFEHRRLLRLRNAILYLCLQVGVIRRAWMHDSSTQAPIGRNECYDCDSKLAQTVRSVLTLDSPQIKYVYIRRFHLNSLYFGKGAMGSPATVYR